MMTQIFKGNYSKSVHCAYFTNHNQARATQYTRIHKKAFLNLVKICQEDKTRLRLTFFAMQVKRPLDYKNVHRVFMSKQIFKQNAKEIYLLQTILYKDHCKNSQTDFSLISSQSKVSIKKVRLSFYIHLSQKVMDINVKPDEKKSHGVIFLVQMQKV